MVSRFDSSNVAGMCVCVNVCMCPLHFPQGSWSPPQQTDDFAMLWLNHLLQTVTGHHTPGHTPLSGRSQLLSMPHSDHFTQNLTSTHTHTHAETQGRVTAGTPAFPVGTWWRILRCFEIDWDLSCVCVQSRTKA